MSESRKNIGANFKSAIGPSLYDILSGDTQPTKNGLNGFAGRMCSVQYSCSSPDNCPVFVLHLSMVHGCLIKLAQASKKIIITHKKGGVFVPALPHDFPTGKTTVPDLAMLYSLNTEVIR